MHRGSPASNGPLKKAHPGEAGGALPDLQGQDGLRNVPMILELVAAMLDSGAGLGRSLELIAGCASPQLSRPLGRVVAALDIGTDWETAWRSSGRHSAEALKLKDALAFAALTGAPSSAILYAQAARLRREQFRAAEKRAAALGVKLVIPLGLCSLPAFICLGVVPVLLAMLPSGG
ncbi:pilus assembly protein TadC [Arthrobacter bambusae]|nr:type II secretion system F family protein [Arthrobacter bambusae]MDQ0099368.1 pilus assembly protein TadC [Arthrobacter bambusae]